jgi:hypothetical protein
MRSQDLKPIFEELLPDFPGFRPKGHLFFREPVLDILTGFCFERSADRWDFYLLAFNQPLYIPKEHVTFSRGRRLMSDQGQGWHVIPEDKVAIVPHLSECMRKNGLPMIEKFDTPLKFARSVAPEFEGGSVLAEYIAYSFALAGEREAAMEWLDRVESGVIGDRESFEGILKDYVGKGQSRRRQATADKYKREHDIPLQQRLDRAGQLRRALADSQDAARKLLAGWRIHTLEALGLSKYAAETISFTE